MIISPISNMSTRQSSQSRRHVRHGKTPESSTPKSWMLTFLIDKQFDFGTAEVTYTSLAHTISAQDFFLLGGSWGCATMQICFHANLLSGISILRWLVGKPNKMEWTESISNERLVVSNMFNEGCMV